MGLSFTVRLMFRKWLGAPADGGAGLPLFHTLDRNGHSSWVPSGQHGIALFINVVAPAHLAVPVEVHPRTHDVRGCPVRDLTVEREGQPVLRAGVVSDAAAYEL